VIQLSIKNTEFLLQQQAKLIVVACNTATTNAIEHLREAYDVPFIGIEPAIKPAALQTESKKIGVLATKGTLTSELFHHTANLHASNVEVIEVEGKGIVELMENGKAESEEMDRLLATFLDPMVAAGIDSLVLGCTHYPFLIPKIKTMLPEGVTIIDSGRAVARQTKAVLAKNQMLNENEDEETTHDFYTNGESVEVLESFINFSFLVECINF